MVQSRNTRQKEIVSLIISNLSGFFTAEDILIQTQQKEKKIGIATIYRILKELKENNTLYSYKCNGRTIYSNSQKSHCHFHCTKTGKSFHFEIENLDFLKDNIPGSIESIQIEVKGVCCDHASKCNH